MPAAAEPRKRRAGGADFDEVNEVDAWKQLLLCDLELARRMAEIERLLDRLRPPGGEEPDDPPETSPAAAPPGRELAVTLGCLLDNLRPARRVIDRFDEVFPFRRQAERLAAHLAETAGPDDEAHDRARDFLAAVPAGDLPALRHLTTCPLCARLARVVLSAFLPPAAGEPAP